MKFAITFFVYALLFVTSGANARSIGFIEPSISDFTLREKSPFCIELGASEPNQEEDIEEREPDTQQCNGQPSVVAADVVIKQGSAVSGIIIKSIDGKHKLHNSNVGNKNNMSNTMGNLILE